MGELIRMDREYQTRDGRPVRVLCVDMKDSHPVVALVDNNGYESCMGYSRLGELIAGQKCSGDLIPRPKTHEVKMKLLLKRDALNNTWLVPNGLQDIYTTWLVPNGQPDIYTIAAKEITVTFTEGEGLE